MEILWFILFSIMLFIYAWTDFFKRERNASIKEHVKMFRILARGLIDKNLTVYESAFDLVLAGYLCSDKDVPRNIKRRDKYGMMSDEARAFFILLDEVIHSRSSTDFPLAKEMLNKAKVGKIINVEMYEAELSKIMEYENNTSDY